MEAEGPDSDELKGPICGAPTRWSTTDWPVDHQWDVDVGAKALEYRNLQCAIFSKGAFVCISSLGLRTDLKVQTTVLHLSQTLVASRPLARNKWAIAKSWVVPLMYKLIYFDRKHHIISLSLQSIHWKVYTLLASLSHLPPLDALACEKPSSCQPAGVSTLHETMGRTARLGSARVAILQAWRSEPIKVKSSRQDCSKA